MFFFSLQIKKELQTFGNYKILTTTKLIFFLGIWNFEMWGFLKIDKFSIFQIRKDNFGLENG